MWMQVQNPSDVPKATCETRKVAASAQVHALIDTVSAPAGAIQYGTSSCVVASRLVAAGLDLHIIMPEAGNEMFNHPAHIWPACFPSHLTPAIRALHLGPFRVRTWWLVSGWWG